MEYGQKGVFKSLAELGEQLGYDICSSSCHREYSGGWLYDLIWYTNDKSNQLSSLPLIVECEWRKKYDAIKYDFEKLLVGKAKYKIMLFQATGDKIWEYVDKMKAGIDAFGGCKNEVYILVCFDEKDWEFKVEIVH